MPVNTTNPLYNNVASAAQNVKNIYANQPTFENTMNQGIIGGDAELTSNRNDYTDKINELFAHDKNMASSQLTATNAGLGVTDQTLINPSTTSMAYSADLYSQKGKEMTSAMNKYLTRKDYLTDVVDKAVKAYEAAAKVAETDYATAKDLRDADLAERQLEETIKKDKADEAGKTGANATGDSKTDAMTDSQVQSEFIKKYGANAYSKIGATQTDRTAAARTLISIVNTGGDFNAKDLMSDSQLKARDAAEQLLSKVLYAENAFTGKESSGLSGTGVLPTVTQPFTAISLKGTKELRNIMAGITPEKIKELSGVAVSDKEFDRLKDLLPGKWLSEQDNLNRLQQMKKILQIGMEMQNKAAMENITLNDAYEKYGKPAYEKYGVEYKLGGTSKKESSTITDVRKKLEDSGYSQSEINDYLKAKGL